MRVPRDEPPAGDPEELRLVQGIQRGDPSLVAEFLERTHHAVYAYAARLTADPDLRRDWTHDCLLRLVDDIQQQRFVYRRAGSLWAWFRKRTYFLLLDSYRRWRRDTGREQHHEKELTLPGEHDPAATLERIEIVEAVESCLEKLPSPDHRRALRLLLFEDLRYQDIADALGCPINTVRAWIRRGRLALRKCLTESLGLDRGEE